MSEDDPITRRIDELIAKERLGTCSPQELEELSLYRGDDSPHGALVRQRTQVLEGDRNWTRRARVDEALMRQHRASNQSGLRKTGVALTAVGIGMLFVPFFGGLAGAVALVTGTFMLAGSIIAERASHQNPAPYDDVDL